MKTNLYLFLSLIILPFSLLAQENQALPCAEDPLYQELDFWMGSWTVYDTAGTEVGKNLIGKAMAGCAIIENWTGADGTKGMSMFYVDNAVRNWKQVWVTETAQNPGGQKEKMLMEKWPDGSLVFQGQYPYKESVISDRTILTPLPDGNARQVIQYSFDEGKTWQTGFIGIYKKQ